VFDSLKRLIFLRKEQRAFHPNATQLTLHLGDHFFGFWRQSLDRRQSLFCIHNLSAMEQTLPLSQLNLVLNCSWRDLISGEPLEVELPDWTLAPYQTLWITNE
jgi:sucrose phosphorylase